MVPLRKFFAHWLFVPKFVMVQFLGKFPGFIWNFLKPEQIWGSKLPVWVRILKIMFEKTCKRESSEIQGGS